MSRCRLFRDKHGVSEIIASLILILITSAGGVLVYSLSLDAFSASSGFHTLRTSQMEEQARERFLIVAVRNTTMPNQLNLTILNYGQIELTIVAVYVNGTNATSLAGSADKIGTGQLTSVQFVSSLPITGEDAYEIIVVSQQGDKNAVYWKA